MKSLKFRRTPMIRTSARSDKKMYEMNPKVNLQCHFIDLFKKNIHGHLINEQQFSNH